MKGQSSSQGRRTPKRASTYRSLEQKLRRVPAGHPIAPTEFPKGRSAIQLFQRLALSQGMAYTPQEEDTFHQSRPEAATGLGLPPSVLRIVMAIGQ